MLRSLSFLILFQLFALALSSQPVIKWQSTLGGKNDDYLWDLKPTPDGGAILAGTSLSPMSGDKTEDSQGGADFWVIKIDDEGEWEWQNTIGGSGVDQLISIQMTGDGGYLLAGDSTSPADGDKTEDTVGESDFWLVKIDSEGSIEWQNDIGGAAYEYNPSLIPTPDGGFLLGGYSNSDASPDKSEDSQGGYDFWVIKLNAQGEIIWDQTIGGGDVDILMSLDVMQDGGYILGGYSDSNAGGDKAEDSNGMFDFWAVKIDTLGEIEWQNTIGGSDTDWLNTLKATPDGGCILGGASYSGISGDITEPNQGAADLWLVKLDAEGAIEWQNSIGGDGQDAIRSIALDTDGGYMIACSSTSTLSGDKTVPSWGAFDIWLLQTDESGWVYWQEALGGDHNDFLLSIQAISNTAYLVGGYSASGVSGNKTEPSQGFSDYWVLYLDELTALPEMEEPSKTPLAYPNPGSDVLCIHPETIFPIQILDANGSVMVEKESFAEIIPVPHLPSGIYFIKEISNGKTQKWIKN